MPYRKGRNHNQNTNRSRLLFTYAMTPGEVSRKRQNSTPNADSKDDKILTPRLTTTRLENARIVNSRLE